MFGYVRPPLKALPKEEAERFQQVYCGLCHTLNNRYGQVARFILNYDFTYLAILLSDGDERRLDSDRCYASPIKKKSYLISNASMDLAADESVILAYWQLRDGVEDHHGLKRFKYHEASALLKRAYRKAAELRPAFDQRVREQLQILRELEERKCDSIDRAADAFAVLLSSAAEDIEDPIRQRVLTQVLYHLGRWVYLVDAADDLREDAKTGNYNPIALRYALVNGEWTADSRHEFALTLDHSIRMMTTSYELWDFGVWAPILETTLYKGLFQVGKAVLDGTFKKTPTRKIEKED